MQYQASYEWAKTIAVLESVHYHLYINGPHPSTTYHNINNNYKQLYHAPNTVAKDSTLHDHIA